MAAPRKRLEAKVVNDGIDIFIVFGGLKVAKRGRPGTPHDGQWVSLEPGYVVFDGQDLETIIVEYRGAPLQ